MIDDEDSEIIRRIPAVMIAFSDKMISRDDNEEIRRLMSVPKVGQFIYREQRTKDKEQIPRNSATNAINCVKIIP